MGQNLVPLVNIKIAGKWMFIPLKMVLIGIYIYISIWVNYNDLTATSLESWLVRGIIPKMALIQVSEIL